MENIVNTLYTMSSEMHGLLNGYGKLNNNLYYSRGRIVSTEEEAQELCSNIQSMLDCREALVDIDIKKLIRDRLYLYVADFYNKRDTNDEFLLLLGFSINLYYIVGLYSTFGKFDIEEIVSFIEENDVKEYVELIDKYLYLKVIEGIRNNVDFVTRDLEDENYELFEEVINLVAEKEDIALENLYNVVKTIHKNYVPDIYMYAKEYPIWNSLREQGTLSEAATKYLNEMLQNYPEFRFGWVYECLERGERFYDTKGNSIKVYELQEKLGLELFWHILGSKALTSWKGEWKDGKVNTIRPALFSEFGIGIPEIETILKDEYYKPIINRRMCGDNKTEEKEVAFDRIRKETERVLGVGRLVPVEENPIRYTEKVFTIRNKELEQINEQLRKSEEQKQKALDDKTKVIRQFSHTYMNMRATGLYNIATELLKNEDATYRNYGRKLLYEYSVKKNLTKDVEMLKLRFEDNEKDLYQRIANSIITTSPSKGLSIEKIIDDAIIRCMVTLVHDGGTNAKHLRAQFENFDWIEIRNNFENDVLLSENVNVREWFKRNMFDLDCSVLGQWTKISFEEDEYAALLLTDIISELLINIFKYADKSQRVELELKDDQDSMFLVTRNYIKAKGEKTQAGGYGLEAESEAIEVINRVNGRNESPITINVTDEIFTVELKIANNIFRER